MSAVESAPPLAATMTRAPSGTPARVNPRATSAVNGCRRHARRSRSSTAVFMVPVPVSESRVRKAQEFRVRLARVRQERGRLAPIQQAQAAAAALSRLPLATQPPVHFQSHLPLAHAHATVGAARPRGCQQPTKHLARTALASPAQRALVPSSMIASAQPSHAQKQRQVHEHHPGLQCAQHL